MRACREHGTGACLTQEAGPRLVADDEGQALVSEGTRPGSCRIERAKLAHEIVAGLLCPNEFARRGVGGEQLGFGERLPVGEGGFAQRTDDAVASAEDPAVPVPERTGLSGEARRARARVYQNEEPA